MLSNQFKDFLKSMNRIAEAVEKLTKDNEPEDISKRLNSLHQMYLDGLTSIIEENDLQKKVHALRQLRELAQECVFTTEPK